MAGGNSCSAQALKSGLIGGALGAAFSGAVNYFLVPMPETVMGNALGHCVSGGISGFLSGFMGLYAWIRTRKGLEPSRAG